MNRLVCPEYQGIERRRSKARFPSIEHEVALSFNGEDVNPRALPATVSTREYLVRFNGEIVGGYSVALERKDGTLVASDVKLRRWYERLIEDGDIQIRLKLSLFMPPTIRIHVWGVMEPPTTENVARAICDVLNGSAHEQSEGAYYLGRAADNGSYLPHAVSPLAAGCKNTDEKVRCNCAWALSQIAKRGLDISSGVSSLVDVLDDPHKESRINAAGALMHHCINMKNEEGIEQLVNHDNRDVRAAAQGIVRTADIFHKRS